MRSAPRAGRWRSTTVATGRARRAWSREIRGAGGTSLAVCADVADPSAPERLFERVEHALGPILVLVNNAGVTADSLSLRIGDEDWARVVETNLTAAFRLTRRALPAMIGARYGRIVNVASVVGLRANPGQANYAAAKAGLIAMTQDDRGRGRSAGGDRERGRPGPDRNRT